MYRIQFFQVSLKEIIVPAMIPFQSYFHLTSEQSTTSEEMENRQFVTTF